VVYSSHSKDKDKDKDKEREQKERNNNSNHVLMWDSVVMSDMTDITATDELSTTTTPNHADDVLCCAHYV